MILGPALLFCPGDRPDRYAKALARADAVVLDLEDAVAPEDKDRAREAVVAAVPGLDADRTAVRVNAADTRWHEPDVQALRRAWTGPLMLPKCTDPDAVAALAPSPVIVLIESAAGVLAAEALAAVPNCVALMWGSEDLIAELGGTGSRTPAGELTGMSAHARHHTLLAARSAGRIAVDTVFVDFGDGEGLRREAESAARAGFDAKACIHPAQADVIRSAFAPTPDQVRWATEVVEGAARHGGVFRLASTMVDAPLVARARAILAASDRRLHP